MMNACLILGILLLIVPTQLFLKYVLEDTEAGLTFQMTTVSSLREGAVFIYHQLELTARYYSTYEHLKELFIVPYIPKKSKTKDSIIQKVFFKDPATGIEVMTIQLSSDDDESSESESSQSNRIKESRKPEQPHTNKKITHVRKGHSSDSPSTYTYTHKEETSSAREVEEYNEKNIYFTRSSVSRNHRPFNVMYTIGQVIKHTEDGYLGVIIGWDTECKAPNWWLKKHGYFQNERKNLITSPHYLVLADSELYSDGDSDLYYIPQDHIILQPESTIESNDLENYFHHYSPSDHKYIPKEWLNKRYPQDN